MLVTPLVPAEDFAHVLACVVNEHLCGGSNHTQGSKLFHDSCTSVCFYVEHVFFVITQRSGRAD